MTPAETSILKVCIRQLEWTLGAVSAKEADDTVRDVTELLKLLTK